MDVTRVRFEITFASDSERDVMLADWIKRQRKKGRNPTEMIKMILEEVISGQSSITGRPIVYQGDVDAVRLPPEEDDETANALDNFGV